MYIKKSVTLVCLYVKQALRHSETILIHLQLFGVESLTLRVSLETRSSTLSSQDLLIFRKGNCFDFQSRSDVRSEFASSPFESLPKLMSCMMSSWKNDMVRKLVAILSILFFPYPSAGGKLGSESAQ